MSGMASRETSIALIQKQLEQGEKALTEHQAKQVLAAYGIPVSQELLVRDRAELQSALDSISPPVAVKIDSPDILHKTEAGLIELGCNNLAELQTAFDRIVRQAVENYPSARVNGVLVQEMVPGLAECIVGMKTDPQFGPTIMFGLGGIFVEVFGDVSLRVAPLTAEDAAQMVRETIGYKILAGARGRVKADVAALEDVILKMSRLALDLEPYVSEIDVNPLIVAAEGQSAKAVDALMLLN